VGSEDLDFLLARDAEAWVDLTGNGDCTPLWHTSPHFEQSFSNDGGKNWEVNRITHQTRLN
jgi:hypothetical protein